MLAHFSPSFAAGLPRIPSPRRRFLSLPIPYLRWRSPPPLPRVAAFSTAKLSSSVAPMESSAAEDRAQLKLEELTWDHSFVRELPGDPRTDIISREVRRACYTKVSPSVEVEKPELVAWSDSVAKLLDLDPKE